MGHNDRGAQRPGAQWHSGHSDPGHNDTGFSKMTKNISKFSYPIMGHNEPGHNDMHPDAVLGISLEEKFAVTSLSNNTALE